MTFIVCSVNALGERTDELRVGSGREEIVYEESSS